MHPSLPVGQSAAPNGTGELLAIAATRAWKTAEMDEKRIDFACPHCGQTGEIVWQGDGDERELVRLSKGFHVEEGRLPGARYVIICTSCDEIDAPRLLKS